MLFISLSVIGRGMYRAEDRSESSEEEELEESIEGGKGIREIPSSRVCSLFTEISANLLKSRMALLPSTSTHEIHTSYAERTLHMLIVLL